jgi:fimbrial chaperone protein
MMSGHRVRVGGRFAVLLFCFFGWITQAYALKVSPLMLEIVAPNGATTLNIEADSPNPVTVQIRVMRWSQVDGENVLEPTTDLVASPPFATLQPKTNYTIRLVRQAEGGGEKEQTYRLLIDQLPETPKGKAQVIGLTLRHSVPVFVRAPGVAKAKLDWSVEKGGSDLVVTATNSGNRTARLTDIRVASGSARVVVQAGLAGYVLPGQSMSWRKSAPKGFAAGPAKISARNETETINAEVEIVP